MSMLNTNKSFVWFCKTICVLQLHHCTQIYPYTRFYFFLFFRYTLWWFLCQRTSWDHPPSSARSIEACKIWRQGRWGTGGPTGNRSCTQLCHNCRPESMSWIIKKGKSVDSSRRWIPWQKQKWYLYICLGILFIFFVKPPVVPLF